MTKLYLLNEIKPSHRVQVGEKAFKLSVMMQHGYPVADGIVITAEVLHQYLEKKSTSQTLLAELADSSLHLDVDDWRQLQQVALNLRQEIMSSSLPDGLLWQVNEVVKTWGCSNLILRPSLGLKSLIDKENNLDGLYESVFCPIEEYDVDLAIKHIWSQLFSAKSLLLWRKVGINLHSINLAILIQPVNNVVVSGKLSATPERLEIQATWGLGVAIDWGEVQPDFYYIESKTGTLEEQHLGNKMLAYHCKNAATEENSLQHTQTSVATALKTFLQVCILNETQQQQYVLSKRTLQQITDLAGQLACQLGKNYIVKWTVIQQANSQQLYLTKVIQPTEISCNDSLMKGIGASTGRVLANALVIEHPHDAEENLPKGTILIASQITPDWLSILQQVDGIVTEKGGLTSHAAIIARELGIPAIVGIEGITGIVKNGDRLFIDGDNGEVHRLLNNAVEEHTELGIVEEIEQQTSNSSIAANQYSTWVSSSNSLISDFSTNLPMTSTQLLVNLSQPNIIEKTLSLQVDGIGLLRSELMALNILNRQHPQTWIREGKKEELLGLWTQKILEFVRAFSPKPVYYRSLDWRTNELFNIHYHETEPGEQQTALGQRGTFSYLQNPQVFEMELTAIKNVQEAGYENIRLILPFVRTLEEFSFCQQKVKEASLTNVREFQLWIMAEVPSVLFLLPEYVKAGVQGISIGTNDLTQLLLGVDRDKALLAKNFDERHPVVMDAISRLIKMSKQAGIPCSICGQAPALYPEIIGKLVEWGITSISVEPEALQRTYQAIYRAEQSLLLEAARRQLQ